LITGCFKEKPNNLKDRARQNVIFGWGYLIRRLGRDRICALREENVELLSDMNDVVYIPYKNDDSWKFSLAKEIAQKLSINLNNALNNIPNVP